MARGKTLIALGLIAVLPSFTKNADKIETSIGAEHSKIEYLIEWPFRKTYEIAYGEIDGWHAIAKSTLMEFGIEKTLSQVSKETEVIDEKKSIQRYLAGDKDPIARYMAKFNLLESAEKIGLKKEVLRTRKELSEEYWPVIYILEDAIKTAETMKNEYYTKGLTSSKDRINEMIKEKKIIPKKAYKPTNSR